MNENEKILETLTEHKKYSTAFREEMKVGVNTMTIKLEGVNRRLDISNGRTAKLEETVHDLQKVDILLGERVKSLRESGEKTNSRFWQIIIGVVVAVILSALGYIIKTI